MNEEMKDLITRELNESAETKLKLKDHAEIICQIAAAIVDTLTKGGKIVMFGNGGSAADAQHIVAELVGKFQQARKGLPAIALTVNTSILTAIGNDFSFEEIFARQVEALVTADDLVVGISTGGYSEVAGNFSKNVVRGIEEAQKIGAKTVGLLGKSGGKLATMVDYPLVVPSNNTQRIQEAHITVGHILCSLVDRALCG
jgi:D-sedoheptulose 7-phosphate isomerase